MWDAIALGLSSQVEQVSDPVELLLKLVTFLLLLGIYIGIIEIYRYI